MEFKGRYFLTERNRYITGRTNIDLLGGVYLHTGTVRADPAETEQVEEENSARVWVSDDGLIWRRVAELEVAGGGDFKAYDDILVFGSYSLEQTYLYTTDGQTWHPMEKPSLDMYVEKGNLFSARRHMPTPTDIASGNYKPISTEVLKLAPNGRWEVVHSFDTLVNFQKVGGKWFAVFYTKLYAVSEDFENWAEINFHAGGVFGKLAYVGGYYHFYTGSFETPVSPATYSHFRSADGIHFEAIEVESETVPAGFFDHDEINANDVVVGDGTVVRMYVDGKAMRGISIGAIQQSGKI